MGIEVSGSRRLAQHCFGLLWQSFFRVHCRGPSQDLGVRAYCVERIGFAGFGIWDDVTYGFGVLGLGFGYGI